MDRGWVKLWRKTLDSAVFQSTTPDLVKVWMWCLAKAAHSPRWVSIKTGRGNTEVKIEAGQFLFGRHAAAKELKSISADSIRRRMEKLSRLGNLTTQTTSHYSIVTICHWETYQGSGQEIDQATDQAMTNQRPPNDHPMTTNKNVKHLENGEKEEASTNVEACAPAKPKAPPPAKSEFSFPTKAGKIWDLSQRKFDEYDATYGEDLDLPGELRKARQWLRDNASRRKTPKGMAAFLTGWLNRSIDSGGRHALGSRAANISDAGAVYNPETGEIVKPLEESK